MNLTIENDTILDETSEKRDEYFNNNLTLPDRFNKLFTNKNRNEVSQTFSFMIRFNGVTVTIEVIFSTIIYL